MKHNYRMYKELSIDRINELFQYDERTGLLHNRVNRRKALKDEIAGCINKSLGYREVKINGITHYQHLLIWMIHHNGNLPDGEIDHINRNKSDNRIENLRDVNHSMNQYNHRIHGKSKYKGVSYHKQMKKWRSQISHKHIGLFINEIDAARARDMAARDMGLEERLMNFSQYNSCLILSDILKRGD